MREKKITAVIMSIFMALSLLPSTVFAASAATLDGKLKVKGEAAVGTTLSADMTEVKTEGLTEDGVSYLWSRKASADTENQNLKELGKEKTYTVTQEDLGSKIVLTITGLEDRGFTGSLKAETGEIKEAAPVQQTDAAQNTDVAENSQDTEIPEEEYLEEVPEEEIPEAQEEPAEDVQVQDDPDAESSTEEYTEEIPDTPEAGSEELDGIPAAQEDAVTTGAADQGTEETVQNDEILIPVDPEGEEAGSESVDGIPPAQEDENTVAGDAEPVYSAEISTEDGTNVLDFGEVPANRITEDTVLYVTVKNTGTGTLHFLENTPDHFAVQDVEEPLQPGSETVLWVAPRQGTAAGSYEDTIMYTTEEGIQVSFTAKVTLTEEIPEQPALTADVTALTFDTEEPQTVHLTNHLDTDITVNAASGNGTVVSEPSEIVIPAGNMVEVSVKPAEGLNPGESYTDTLTFTDINDQANVVTVQITVTLPGKQSDVIAETDKVDLGTVLEGYAEAPAEKSVLLTNQGTGDAELSEPVSVNGEGYFSVLLDGSSIAAGENVSLIIRGTTGLAAGTYSESFRITDTTTQKEIVITASMTVEAAKHSLSASPTELEFASAKKGYGQIEAQQITVTNNGNVSETLTQPAGTSFEVSGVDASALTLQPGASVSFTVRPKVGLEPGTYKESIKFASNAAETGVAAEFQVIKGTATINKIETPKDISGLPNGTKKEAKALGLPSTVVIGTTAGNMNASVSWDVKSCNYDPSAVQEQSFTVKGTVKLPDGVDNDNKLTLATSIRVHVKAYAPKTVSADDNRITGIEYNGAYTTQSRISFTAIGAGMDNASPRKGDTRYLPLNWTVINTNGWSSAPPYKATFGMAQSGDYTLKVAFQLQTYDGSTWKNSDNYDTKKVPFSVTKAKVTGPGQNLTPAANRRNAVKTGDSTPILPLVIILVIAAAAIGGVVIYRKRK